MLEIIESLKKKIFILDGATGTAIQNYNPTTEDYQGKKGCNEILNITREDIIKEIHNGYIEAGADIIETNSFNCNRISLEEYKIPNMVRELALKSAKLARECADNCKEKKIYVAGSVGPTSKSLSVPTGENPYDRALDFDELKSVYFEHIEALVDGGVDIILIETIFDGLNAKAGVLAVEEVMEKKGIIIPVMISFTVNKQGRIFTGQSAKSLIVALDRENIISYGFNCSFGAKELVPLIEELGKFTKKPISLYPNAGLPNEKGEYDEVPEVTVSYLKELINNKRINILGGCCGTTFEHIKAISRECQGKLPREFDIKDKIRWCVSGNDIYDYKDKFTQVGERNNVSGSKIFRNLINEQNYTKALEIARTQIERGATVIDINLDDGLLNSVVEMERYLRIIQNDRFVSQVPIMIDSSDFDVIKVGLKNIAGRGIVNSISLKEGEEEFIKKAKYIKKYGANLVVMAFDERGQGVTAERKIEICNRSYNLLKKIGYDDSEIIFDPNILTIGTGSEEDRYNGIHFLNACQWIKKNLPDTNITGGLSNLSFAFRGNNLLRAGIHNIFLEQAKKIGMNFAIMNPGEKTPLLSENQIQAIRELIDGKENAVDKILELEFQEKKIVKNENKIEKTLEERLKEALILGGSTTFEEDVMLALQKYKPIDIIQEILMAGMDSIGVMFEKGEMYLPQLIRSASVMNIAVNLITPYMEKNIDIKSKGTVVMATVEGDVHDIGKNIVGTVLKCNGYNIIDLGVMASKEKILENAKKYNADVVTLSGLISPSLKEMEKVLQLFNENNMNIPVFIAGATTSQLHTALKLEPLYKGKTIHVNEAIDTLTAVNSICSDEKEKFLQEKTEKLEKLRKIYLEKNEKKVEKIFVTQDFISETVIPNFKGNSYIEFEIKELENYINWDMFLYNLKVKNTPQEKKILDEGREILEIMKEKNIKIRCSYGIYPCINRDKILEIKNIKLDFSQEKNSICSFLNENDYIGGFAVSVYSTIFKKDEYKNLLEQLILTRLAEAGSEYLEKYIVDNNIWKIKIRPAIGYPTLPNHSMKKEILELIEGDKTGIVLTKNGAMSPLSSVCGIYLANPKSYYFN